MKKVAHFNPVLSILIFVIFLVLHERTGFAQTLSGKSASDKSIQFNASTDLSFLPNYGQIADTKGKPQPEILFTTHNGQASMYLTARGIYYQFNKYSDPAAGNEGMNACNQSSKFSIELIGASLHHKIRTEKLSGYSESYYLNHCPKGIKNVPSYGAIVYENVYPKIDWVLYGKNGKLEYDFVVRPGGNPARIKMKINDATNSKITASGGLLITTNLGQIFEQSPQSFIDGQHIASRFTHNIDGTFGFNVRRPMGNEKLIIDPVVQWSSYYGGSNADFGRTTIAMGGHVYLMGYTTSTGGIAVNPGYDTSFGGGTNYDAFIIKFDTLGNRIWGTYYWWNFQ